jgi:cytochrome b561
LARTDALPCFDRVARCTHWLTALLVAGVVVLGWLVETAPRGSPSRELLLLLHRSLGLAILALTLFRGGWRLFHPPPLLLPHQEGPRALASLTHFLLYALLIAMPLAGWVDAAAAGHDVSLFGLVALPPVLPENARLSQWAIAVHLVGQYALYLFVALHVAGALYHGLLRRDGVWQRMWSLR